MARAITTEHLQAAFKAMAWLGWTFEAAMADPVRSRLLQLRARQMCQAQARRRVVVAPRQTGQLLIRRWLAEPNAYPGAHLNDLKRAAAGDRDD
jgi:hypothetical protein